MKKWLCIGIIIITLMQCRDAYNVTPAKNEDGLLVVEGILNAKGRTNITLSRTTKLSDKRIASETGAFMFIEEEATGSVYTMNETGEGVYQSDSLVFNTAGRYRLRILTKDSRQYATEYKNFLATPVVDSLSWKQDADGVRIFSHAHDASGNTQYYKWDYEETWEFKSAFRAIIYFKEVPPGPTGNRFELAYLDPVTQSVDNRLYTCYNSRPSTTINVLSTTSLGSSVLFYPVRFIEKGSIELSYLYSIKIRQYALTEDGYEFFTRMKKNTESLGSIFDAQPSEIAGNVKCLTDSSELVIGYVEATTIEEKRLFIDSASLDSWGYDQGCFHFVDPDATYPYPNDPDLFDRIIERGYVPTIPVEEMHYIKAFYVEDVDCVDCRRRGTNIKPDFWP